MRYDTDHTGKKVQILAAEFQPNAQVKINLLTTPKSPRYVQPWYIVTRYMLLACVDNLNSPPHLFFAVFPAVL